MKTKLLASILGLACALALLTGCTSVIKVAPFPDSTPWGDDVRPLGTVMAKSGAWPLSLHSAPPDHTFYSALRANASSQFGVPEPEIVLGEVTVQIGAEMDGTIRDWKATAEAGQRKVAAAPKAKSAADSLIELKKLFDAGAITPVEYEAKKKTLLEKL
jgi:hypothetical protein